MLIQENQTKDVRGGTKDEPKSVQQKSQQGEGNKNTTSPPKQTRAATLRAGIPGAGGYATARAMTVFYQMMAQGGVWNGVRIVSPRMIDHWIGAAPRSRGSSDACTFHGPSAGMASSDGGRMRP